MNEKRWPESSQRGQRHGCGRRISRGSRGRNDYNSPNYGKKNFKVLSPLESVEEEVSQGHTEEGMTSLMSCYNLYKKIDHYAFVKKTV